MSGGKGGISIFIADDHQIVRDGLRLLIDRQEGMRTIGDAANGRALVEGALEAKPDVVITDISMPELNGIEAVRQLRARGFSGVIIVLSQRDDRKSVAEALEAGANAYLLKEFAFEQVVSAIKATLEGRRWLSPELADLMEGSRVALLSDLLTARELEVLQMLAEGHGTKEVAFRLHVSPKTIETHRLSLLAKLKAGSVVDLVRIALKEGLIEL